MKIMRGNRGALVRVFVRRTIVVNMASLIALFLAAQTPQKPANPVTIDGDGTVHVPAQAVPQSAYLSPEAKAYVTQQPEGHAKPTSEPRRKRSS